MKKKSKKKMSTRKKALIGAAVTAAAVGAALGLRSFMKKKKSKVKIISVRKKKGRK